VRVNAICPGVIGTPVILGWFENNAKLEKSMVAQEPNRAPGQTRGNW